MDEKEQALFGLMQVAKEQQQAINAALAALKNRQTDLTETAMHLQTVIQTLLPAARAAAHEGATKAVKAALENASQTAVDAVAQSCQPLLVGLAGVEAQAEAAEGQLKEAVKWFGWRWAGIAAATACGAILAVTLVAWGAVWWQRSQLAGLKVERDQVSAEVAAAQSTVAELEKRTGGVRYEESKKGRFIVTRKGYDAWTCEDMECIRLK